MDIHSTPLADQLPDSMRPTGAEFPCEGYVIKLHADGLFYLYRGKKASNTGFVSLERAKDEVKERMSKCRKDIPHCAIALWDEEGNPVTLTGIHAKTGKYLLKDKNGKSYTERSWGVKYYLRRAEVKALLDAGEALDKQLDEVRGNLFDHEFITSSQTEHGDSIADVLKALEVRAAKMLGK